MADNTSEKKPSSRKSLNKQDSPVANVKFTSNNPYLNFLSEFRKRPENRRLNGAMLFRAAAKAWKAMSPNQKVPYINAAKKHQKSFDNEKGIDKNVRKYNTKTNGNQNKDFTTLKKSGFRPLYYRTKADKKAGYVPPKKSLKREQERCYPKRCSRCGHRHGDEEDNSPSATTTTRCSSTTNTNATTRESRTSNSGSDVSRSSYSF